MADGFLLDVDTSKLREADNYFKSMVSNAEKLQTALKGALGDPKAFAAVNVLERVKSFMTEIGDTRLSPKVDTKRLEEFSSVMSNIVEMMQLMSQQQGIQFFDTKSVRDMEGNAIRIQKIIDAIDVDIKKKQEQYNNIQFKAPINPRTGNFFGKNTKAYETAVLAYGEEQDAVWREIKALEEKKKGYQEDLRLAKMTEDEKLQYVMKTIAKESAEKQKEINEQRARYKTLLSEQLDIQKKIEQAGQYGDLGEDGQKTIDEYNRQFEIRDKERRKIEEDYAVFVVDLTENAQRKMLDANLKRIKQEQEAQQLAYRTSAQGALEYAGKASTINEMKDAQKYLQIARGNVDVNDKTTIDQLNEAYTRLRATIENLTTAEKNENSLQPTLRNEYARLLVELDKITAAQERMAKSSVYQSAKSKSDVTQMTEKELAVLKDEEALQKRLDDVQAKMNSIEKAAMPDLSKRIELEKELAGWIQTRVELGKKAGGKDISEARKGGGSQDAKDYLFAEEQVKKLQAQQESAIDDVKRKHDADRARESIALTEKTEAQKAEIAKRRMQEAVEQEKKTGVMSSDKALWRIDFLENNVQNAAQAEMAIKSLENAKKRLDKTDSRYEETIKDLNKAIAKHKRTIEQTNPEVEEAASLSAKEALHNARNARTMQDLRKALKDLKQAREELDIENDSDKIKEIGNAINDVNGKISELEGKQKEVKQNNNDLSASFAGLKRLAIAWMGIEALKNYARKVVETRREFELLQKSLQNLLQDKDEANKLWNQTLQLALVSPFSVKDLIGYTKQLAAYRIETEKLHDRTKRLADVSAGLGVDMQRLILAYGQVRAASFLRATELRQFTEAGIPMLDELSKKLSEVEGRFISVGDVMEMISKRKISFEDVDETFISMTSQGGVFYQMQEKQAETIHGMLSNMKDAFDLMFNEIGNSTDSYIKGIIQGITNMAKEWREWADGMTSIAIAVIAGKVGTSIASLFIGIGKLIQRVKKLKNLFRALSATGWGVLLAALASVASYIYMINKRTDETLRKFQEVDKELTKDLNESIRNFKTLADKLNDVTTSYTEQQDALKELNRLYGDILPDQMLEVETIKSMAEGYEEATTALKTYYNAKAREQKRQLVEAAFNENFSKTVDDIFGWFEGDIQHVIRQPNKDNLGFIEFFEADEETIRSIIGSIIQDMKDGVVKVDKFYEELVRRTAKYYNKNELIDIALSGDNAKGIYLKQAEKAAKKIVDEYKNGMANIKGLPFETKEQEEEFKQLQKLREEYDAQAKKADELSRALSRLYEAYKKAEDPEAIQELHAQVLGIYKELGQEPPENFFDSVLTSALDVSTEMQRVKLAIIDAFKFKKLNEFYAFKEEEDGNLTATQNIDAELPSLIDKLFKELDKKAGEISGGELRNTIESIMREIADGVDLSIFDKILIDDKTSLEDYRKLVEEEIDTMQGAIDHYNKAVNEAKETGTPLDLVDAAHDKERLKAYEKAIPILTTLYNLLGGADKKKGAGEGSLVDERIKVIDDMVKKYDKYVKELGHDTALKEAFNSYIDAFSTAYKDISWVPKNVKKMTPEEFVEKVMNFADKDDVVKFLQNLANDTKNEAERIKVLLAKGEYAYEMQVKVKTKSDEDLNKRVEKMFSDYELSLDFEKLNVPPDLLGVETTNLKDLRKKLEDLRPQFIGTDQEAKYNEWLKKLGELEDKAQKERAKQYIEYLLKTQSERVKIKLEEVRKIKEIEALNLDDELKSNMLQGVRDETQRLLDKAEWDSFKNSDLYVQMFEDLGVVSNKVLSDLKKRLTDMRGSLSELSPTELKEVVSQLQKVTEEQISRNPFKDLGENVKDGVKALKRLKQEQEAYNKAFKNQETAQKRVDDLQLSIEKTKATKEATQAFIESGEASDLQLWAAQATLPVLDEQIAGYEQQLTVAIKRLVAEKGITEEAARRLVITKQEVATATKLVNEIGRYGSQTVNSVQNMVGMLENWGVNFGEEFKQTLDGFGQMLGALESIDISKPFSVITGGINFIAGLGNTIGSIFGFGSKDKKKEREIRKEAEAVARLQKEYEKLEKATATAYNIDEINTNYEAQKKNLEDRIASTKRMRALEDEKKKTDHAKMQEYTEQIEEYKQQLKELEDQRINQLGGIAGEEAYLSTSQSFVDAWLEAFKETGDGLFALEEQFEEVFMNLVKKQILGRGVDMFLEPLYKHLEGMLDDDGIMSTEDFDNFRTEWESIAPGLDKFLSELIDTLEITDDITKQTGELSGLQEGIQGITEDQADILAAYWSSVRFIVSNIEQKFTDYARQMLGSDANANPILGELKEHTKILTDIDEKLGSIIGHSGGAHVKTYLISQ